MKRTHLYIYMMLLGLLSAAGCREARVPEHYAEGALQPYIYPDCRDVTVPVNMAPLTFQLMSSATEAVTRFSVGDAELVLDGLEVCPGFAAWRQLVEKCLAGDSIAVDVYEKRADEWVHCRPFYIHVSPDSIDPWLTYRLISPSYVTYEELTINQRCLESYEERVVYDNMLCSTGQDGQCINCHHSQLGNPNRTQFHARQNMGGTLLNIDGKLQKVNLKTDSTISAGVYPAWHPTQNLIAYSTNNTMQSFHTLDADKIEVLDAQSDLILYDPERGEVSIIANDPDEFETFPCWSPDGRWLYYSSAHFVMNDSVDRETEAILRYKEIKYDLYRKAFDPDTRQFGPRESVFPASAYDYSATLPRVSPDGRWLLMTMGRWGTFHIWHRDADLYIIDLNTGVVRAFSDANSPSVESYHTWSSNGRWVVFSSRRTDDNYTRPFFTHVDSTGHATKPFELPSARPGYHRELMKSYNIPEFLRGPVTVTPQQFADALHQEARQATFRPARAGQ